MIGDIFHVITKLKRTKIQDILNQLHKIVQQQEISAVSEQVNSEVTVIFSFSKMGIVPEITSRMLEIAGESILVIGDRTRSYFGYKCT